MLSLFLGRTVVGFIAGLVLLPLTAVGQDIASASLNLDEPFGVSWELSIPEAERLREIYVQECLNDPIWEEDADLLPSDISEKACSVRDETRFYLPTSVTPEPFRDGSIQVFLGAEGGVIATEFRFLHSIIWGDDDQNDEEQDLSEARWNRAAELRALLIGMYGEPDANGEFNQSSIPAFQPTNSDLQPCSVWIKGLLFIQLCAERGILQDGIEMSLSFIRLDRTSRGAKLLNTVAPYSVYDPNYAAVFDTSEQETQQRRLRLKKRLEAWWNQPDFKACNSRLNRSRSEITNGQTSQLVYTMFPQHADLGGEDLALYAIETYNNGQEAGWQNSLGDGQRIIALLTVLTRAAAEGSASAATELGGATLYCNHRVIQDFYEAAHWYQIATDRNDPTGMYNLAWMQLSGWTRTGAWNTALALLNRCSDLGHQQCREDFKLLTLP